MNAYQTTLTIDFGAMGLWNGEHPFRIQLDAELLAELIRAAVDAHRVYELLLIERPGDVWEYVSVVLEEVPKRVADRLARARQNALSNRWNDAHPWPEDRIPFKVFDSLFIWAGEDTEPEDEAWLNTRDTVLMRSFARQVLSIARAAQTRMEWSDHLLRYISSRVRSGEHPYCYLDRDVARAVSRKFRRNDAHHTAAFYEKLSGLLQDVNLASVAYRADGDYRVLRMMATEQRRRANLTGHATGSAMQLSALVNHKVSNEAWESMIWFFDEGLAHGDLFIEGGGLRVGDLRALVQSHLRVPGRFILSSQDEGSIAGFTAESGDGWVLYTNQSPDNRRTALERIGDRLRRTVGAILSFADSGATLFDYDKSVVLVGEAVPAAARGALASVVAEWQSVGGDPLLVVIGDTTPFDLAGCRGVAPVAADAGDEGSLARWLSAELQQSRPWIDVVMALHAPDWAGQVLAFRSQRVQNGPWPVWVVATEGESRLKVDQWLDGDLEQVLNDAHRRAKAGRFRSGWRA